jgi:hypothetical protein
MRISLSRMMLVLGVCCLASSTVGATLTLSPLSDGAGTDQPQNGVFDSFFPGNALYLIGFNSNAEYRSIAEFSLSSIPAGSTISSATLKLHAVAGVNTTSMGVFTRLFAGNGIAEISDLTQNGSQAGPVIASIDATAELAYTTAFQTLFASGAQFAAFTILGNGGGVLEFGSNSYSNLNSRPTLEMTYTPVPEPAAWLLAAIGGVAVFAYRSRHSRRPAT